MSEPVHGTMYRPMCSWFYFYPAARTAPSFLFSFVFSICLPSISLSSVDSAAMNVIAPTQTNMVVFKIPYCGKLSREKTFVNLVVLCLFAKVFPAKFGGVAPFGTAKVSNSRTFSPRKLYFPPIHNSFPLECFPLYSRSLT